MDTIGPWVQVVMTLLLTGVMGLVAWSFKRLYRTGEERLRRLEEQMDRIHRDYVLKADFVRGDAVYRTKLDAVAENVSELKGQEGVTAELVSAFAAHLRQNSDRSHA